MNLRHLFVSALLGAAATVGFAQPNRILSRIDSSATSALQGRVHPLATAANDQGAVESGFQLPYITMMLRSTPAQQAHLQQLLADQQNPASPSYHQWLTPEQYADQFGVSADDATQMVTWLESQGFAVDPVSRSRTFITFSGTAGQVQNAFGTAIHHYKLNGVMHYANATDLTIPATLAPIVAGFRGMTDFHPKPKIKLAKPHWSNPPDAAEWEITRALAPDDFATIYDVTPLYTAGNNGAGQKIAVVGQSSIVTNDINNFWQTFGLTSVKLVQTLVNPRQNPGQQIQTGDIDESSLDLEWAGAVARGGTIVFVYSDDVWTSAMYAVDQDVAPVLSMSYGNCEALDLVDLPTYRQTAQQANAEGITWLAAAGDQGAADCDFGVSVAEQGLAVDEPGSMPEVTSMGGTALSNLGSYWSSGNSATDASAKGYVPEIVWNDTAQSLALGEGFASTGGGISSYFPQPAWQTSGGVPNDGWRHVPDISFNASEFVVPYYVYCSVCEGSDQNNIEYPGGTSCATPTMAGVVALLNEYLKGNGVGNINPVLYNLAQTFPSAFHSNITGNNDVPCASGAPGCSSGVEGFSASGSGYSSATGLGSVDVTKLIQNWSSGVPTGPVVEASLDQNPVYQGFAESCGTSSSWNFQLTLQEQAGFTTSLTAMTVNGASYTSKINQIFSTPAIGARQLISGCMSLSGVSVPENITFNFSGPNWSSTLTIPFQGPQAPLKIVGVSNAASGQQTFAPGQLISVYGTALGTLAQAATTVPLPEFMGGFNALICPVSCNTGQEYGVPLWYVSPNQVNIQIPIEVTGAVDLNVVNPYNPNGIDTYFTVGSIAPGIFMLEDGTSRIANGVGTTASVGQVFTLYMTGQGRVSPIVDDGYSPSAQGLSSTPAPRSAVTVTVAGISAVVQFAGIPSWSVGVTQVNFTIPPGVQTGNQPVIVSVGTTASMPAYVTIQ